MNTTLCPGEGCAKASTCLRAIRFTEEPLAPNRSAALLWDGSGDDCFYYYEDTGKRATREPNSANLIGAYVNERWPELVNYLTAWVTGSTVWRIAYAMPVKPDADLDMFVLDPREYGRLLKVIRKLRAPTEDTKEKRRGSMPGERVHTNRGWVDVWLPQPESGDVINEGPRTTIHALRCYPPTTHAHCRVAYNPATTALIMLANERATDEGAAEYHERAAQWHIEQAERLIKLARRSA